MASGLYRPNRMDHPPLSDFTSKADLESHLRDLFAFDIDAPAGYIYVLDCIELPEDVAQHRLMHWTDTSFDLPWYVSKEYTRYVYVGRTNDLVRRIWEHIGVPSKSANFTLAYPPESIIGVIPLPDYDNRDKREALVARAVDDDFGDGVYVHCDALWRGEHDLLDTEPYTDETPEPAQLPTLTSG